jgi:hypothetical protein
VPKQKKTRKPGRPPLPKGQAKGRIVPVRLTSGQAALFGRVAKANRQTLSEWIRDALNAKVSAENAP